MAIIRNIAVSITANTRQFSAGVTNASSRIKRFSAGVAAAGIRVAAFGAAAAAAAVVGLAAIIRSTAASIDTLAKTARILGITTEALQSFHLAANLAGLSNEQFDKSIKRMIKSVADAGNGLATQARAFAVLGLSAEELATLRPDEIFRRIADRVRETGQSVESTAAIMDIFGAELIPLLQGGSAALDQAAADAEKLGLSLSRVDAAQVEAANDAMTRLKGILAGVAQKLTVAVAPVLEAIVNKMIEWGSEGGRMGKTVTTAVEGVAKALAFVADLIQGIRAGWKLLQVSAQAAVAMVLTQLSFLAKGLQEVIGWLTGVEVEFGDTMLNIAAGARAAAEVVGAEFRGAFDELASDSWGDRILKTFADIRKASREAAEEMVAEAERAAKGSGDAAKETIREVEKAAEDAVAAAVEIASPEEKRGGFRVVDDLAKVAIGGRSARDIDPVHLKLDVMEKLFREAIAAIKKPTLIAFD